MQYYDQYIEINLSELEPHIVGPHSPDIARPISRLAEDVQKSNWPMELSAALIGSCTNSSYQDMSRAASIAKQAAENGLKAKIPFMITPGSEQIYRTMQRDGHIEAFQKIGGTVLANACGPCIGQWKRSDITTGQKNSIVTSYNRNFKKRNDANPNTHAFIASPEVVTALALTGKLDYPLQNLQPPMGSELPTHGFVFDITGYEAPTGVGQIAIDQNSKRLALLEPFTPWKHGAFNNLFILLKAKGKCTTDHISPAGKWLQYRGHLDNISDNMYSGATNAFTDNVGNGRNILTTSSEEFSTIARYYKKLGKGWIVVGDENYGEGSSREHAAMEPRHLGCRVVIAKSFARIAETNLKKQGILPLWFTQHQDYEKVQEKDMVSVDANLKVGEPIYVILQHADGSIDVIETKHTFTEEQIKWFNAGSALNYIRHTSN